MAYISIAQAAEKWGLTARRVQELCKTGAIPEATRLGRAWMIPSEAQKPADGRLKAVRAAKVPDDGLPHQPLIRKNPCLIYTDLYSIPGTADEIIASLREKHPEAARIFQAQIDYQRGDTQRIEMDVQYFLRAHSGLNAVISASSIMCKYAMWRGDLSLWRKARQHVYEAPCRDEADRQVVGFWLAVLDSFIHVTDDMPEWFRRGVFDCLPADSVCTARVFYVRYLFIKAKELAAGKIMLQNVEGLGLMRTLPYIVEPMISQARIERTLMPEIQLRLIAATVYHDLGEDDRAIAHIDRAIELALPDRLHALLVEARTGLDNLLDDRLAIADPEVLRHVREMHGRMNGGWIKLHNLLLERNVSNLLTVREREVAKMAAYGFGNAEIAARLHIEVSSVKRHIFSAMNKVGAEKRAELGRYI